MSCRPLILASLLLFASTSSAPGQDLAPIPEPDLSRVEAAVRSQLEGAAARVGERKPGRAATGRLATGYGELGRLYHAYDFSAAAEACYRNARLLAPEDFRWAYYLGFLHQTGGRLDQAAEGLRQTLVLRPGDLPALLRLATVELDRDRQAEARRLFERVLELDPDAAAAHHGLGKIAARDGDHGTAIRHYERALELQPQATLIHYPLALAYREIGERESAELHLRQRGNAGPSFPDPLVRALDELATGVGLRLTRAGVAMAEGRQEAALEELRKAVAVAPENPEARLYLGLALAQSGDLEQARAALQVGVRLDPGSALAQDALGTVLAHAGSDQEAIEHFEKAVAIAPGFADAHFRLGSALGRLGRHARAAQAFSRALELDPRDSDALLARATARIDLGELEAARGDLERIVERDPQNARARLRLGEVLQRLGSDGALEEFLRAIDIGLEAADSAAAHLSAGNLLVQRRDFETAIDHYRAAVDLDPALTGARYNLAGALSSLGRHQDAAAVYREVLAAQPENVAVRLYLSEALHALGRHREVREQLEEGLAASPGSGRLAHALARTLAASPDRSLRDGARAVELALGVFAAQKSLEHAETIAMAFAEMGRFDEAVRWQKEVISGAEAEGRTERFELLRRNLALYERREACCGGD